jgi:hypothetical protein
MIAERREYPRHAVRWLVAAKDLNDSSVPVTVTDISATGIGLFFTGTIAVGDVLKFRLLLPDTNYIIQCKVRIVWTLRGNIGAAEFENISAPDSDVLNKWLRQRHARKGTCLPPASVHGVKDLDLTDDKVRCDTTSASR